MNQRNESPSLYVRALEGEDGAIVLFGEIETETAEDFRDACHVALGYRPALKSAE